MSIIPAGCVSKEEYTATIDKLIGVIYEELGGENPSPPTYEHEAFVLAQAAHVLGHVWSNQASRFYRDDRIIGKAIEYLSLSVGWAGERSRFGTSDFTAIALYRFVTACKDRILEDLMRRIADYIVFVADNFHITGSYINHNLNTALVCEYVYNLSGNEEYHRWCKAKTDSSLYYFDRNDGRNPEIAETYGIYGLSVLAEIAAECADNDPTFSERIISYLGKSIETLPTYYFYDETGDLIAINSRETVKMLMYAPVCWNIDGFEIFASLLNDGRYKSIARFMYDYWTTRVYDENGIIRFPRWERNDDAAPFHLKDLKVADRAGFSSVFAGYAFTRAVDYHRDLKPVEFVIKDKVAGRQFFQRHKVGTSQVVISNVLYSPIAYMTKGGCCLVGEELQGRILRPYVPQPEDEGIRLPDGSLPVYMRDGNDYVTSNMGYIDNPDFTSASMYSYRIGAYSTAFFDDENLIWAMTLDNDIKDAHYDLYVY